MAKQLITLPTLSPPIAPYPAGVRMGDLVFLSGIVGTNSDGKVVGRTRGKSDMTAQAGQILTTIKGILQALGGDLSRLVQLKAFITDWRSLEKYHQAYRSALPPPPYPAGATVMAGIAQQGLALEIEGVGVVGQSLQRLELPGVQALGPYFPGVIRAGELLFLSASAPVDARGGIVGRGNVREQSKLALDTLCQGLSAAGFSPSDVVRASVTLADARYVPSFNRVYSTYFREPYPAMTVVLGQLPVEGALVAVDAVASKGQPRTVVSPSGGHGQVKWSARLSPASGPFSLAVRAGDLAMVSALLSLSPGGRLTGAGDISAQIARCLDQLGTTLGLLGLTSEDVVKTTVYIADWRNYWPYNDLYGSFFQPPYPARSTFQMGLPVVGALIGIDAIAVAGASQSAQVVVSDTILWERGKRSGLAFMAGDKKRRG